MSKKLPTPAKPLAKPRKVKRQVLPASGIRRGFKAAMRKVFAAARHEWGQHDDDAAKELAALARELDGYLAAASHVLSTKGVRR